VVDAVYPDYACRIVDAIQHAVWPAPRAVLPRQLASQWFPDPAGFSREVTEREFDDR
jgi:hypothetical protein